MVQATVKNKEMDLLPFGWSGTGTEYFIVYLAPNLLAAENFISGSSDIIKTHVEAIKKDLIVQYENEEKEVKQLKRFCYISDNYFDLKQINNTKIKGKKPMTTISKNKTKGTYGTNIVTLTSCQAAVDDFINDKAEQGLSVRLVRNKDDKYLIYKNQQRLYPNENVNANDFLGTISGPLGVWRDSFLPGAINYYEKLHDALYQDSFIPKFEYKIRTYYGTLAQFLTDYYLVRYNGDVCRLSVQDYNNVQLLSNDIA